MQCDICATDEDVIWIEHQSIGLCLECQQGIADFEDEEQTKEDDLH